MGQEHDLRPLRRLLETTPPFVPPILLPQRGAKLLLHLIKSSQADAPQPTRKAGPVHETRAAVNSDVILVVDRVANSTSWFQYGRINNYGNGVRNKMSVTR